MDLERRSAQRRTLAALLLLASSSQLIEAQTDGTLDESFWVDGRVILDSPLRNVAATVVAPDGRLVIVGERSGGPPGNDLFWATLEDTSLGTPCVPNAPGGATSFIPYAAVFDVEGRLLIAGQAAFAAAGIQGFAMRYLYPACDLDEGFNLDGLYRTNLNEAGFESIAFDSNARIVLAGYKDPTGVDSNLLVVRLAHTGLLDLSFANFGLYELDLSADVSARAVAVQPNDRIVVGGQTSPGLFVMRLDSLGDPDGTFAGDGFFQTALVDIALALAIDPITGHILAAGFDDSGPDLQFAVVRLNVDGALVDTFDDDGIWTDSTWDGEARSIQLQTDGKILVAGDAFQSGMDRDFVVFRLLPNGDLDDSFGLSGSWSVNFGVSDPTDDRVLATTLHAGKLVVAGDSYHSGGHHPAVARLWSDLIFTDGFERGSAGGWSRALP